MGADFRGPGWLKKIPSRANDGDGRKRRKAGVLAPGLLKGGNIHCQKFS
jgi:hypothetical protein